MGRAPARCWEGGLLPAHLHPPCRPPLQGDVVPGPCTSVPPAPPACPPVHPPVAQAAHQGAHAPGLVLHVLQQLDPKVGQACGQNKGQEGRLRVVACTPVAAAAGTPVTNISIPA